MSNKYFICFDMDGTLLNNKQKISFLTKQYLRRLHKKGHTIVLASGRPYREMKRYYDELKLNSPIVCLGGCHYFSPFDQDFPNYEFSFDRKVAIEIVAELLKIGAIDNAFCENNEHIWVHHRDPELINFFWKTTGNENIIYGPFEKTLTINPTSLLLETKNKDREKEIETVIKKYKTLNVRFWFGGHYSEIYFDGFNKASALEKIAQYYGIDKSHTIAFGDQHNDIEMLKWAKIGVAMKNATAELKSYADYVTTKDNNHNGIYFELKDIFKKIRKKQLF
ncbi:MAG: Cof-type HAD-IIB family hydrolase [Bacilli bacterium]